MKPEASKALASSQEAIHVGNAGQVIKLTNISGSGNLLGTTAAPRSSTGPRVGIAAGNSRP
jgi:hypothetical protein